MDGTDGISVGVIGPADLVAAVCALGHPMLCLIPASYEDEGEAADRYRSVASRVDVILFTGPTPYHLVSSREDVTLPVVHIPLRGTVLYPALYRLRTSRVSIDTVSLRDVQSVCAEFGLDAEQVTVYEGMATRRDLVTFHEERYRTGQTLAAITCLRTAHKELTRRGIPCHWVTPSHVDMMNALDQAQRLGESARNFANQTVIGLISLDGDHDEDGATADEIQRRALSVQACLLRFAEECDGYTVPLSDREWHLFTTRGPLDRATENLTRIRPLEEIRLAAGITASAGFGFGLTAARAGVHARTALQQARRRGGDLCYAMMEDQRLIGPLGETDGRSQALRPPEPALAALADTSGIAAKSLRRLISHLTRFQTFTAHEIAPVLGLSLRSAHRILARMEGAGVVEVVGQERLLTPGRPRQVYKLTDKTLALSVG